MLEDWYNNSTFASATWRGDAQRYWLDQVLEPPRLRRDQWRQSPRRASLEPAFILGDRKLIPEAANAVECVANRTSRCPSKASGRGMHASWLLHCRAHHLLHHETVEPPARCQ